jgi:hypothetical protein
MLGIAMVEHIPAEYGPLLLEELGVSGRDVPPPAQVRNDFRAVIIGSGISGLCCAITLKQAGIPYRVLEKNSRVGGTWWENCYPGVGVDTPSHLYSYSFSPNTSWSRYFACGGEVYDYLRRLAEDCTVLISGVGMVNRSSKPDIPWLDHFNGPIVHTAQWRADLPLAGKRIAHADAQDSDLARTAPELPARPARVLPFGAVRRDVVGDELAHQLSEALVILGENRASHRSLLAGAVVLQGNSNPLRWKRLFTMVRMSRDGVV